MAACVYCDLRKILAEVAGDFPGPGNVFTKRKPHGGPHEQQLETCANLVGVVGEIVNGCRQANSAPFVPVVNRLSKPPFESYLLLLLPQVARKVSFRL